MAPHHARDGPRLQETVEGLFADGLVRVVFATETLVTRYQYAARVRRDREPVQVQRGTARTAATRRLHPADRSGRSPGHRRGGRGSRPPSANTCPSSGSPGSPRPEAIRSVSSFRPTYNMAVNLIARYPRHRAEELLRGLLRPVSAASGNRRHAGRAGEEPGCARRRSSESRVRARRRVRVRRYLEAAGTSLPSAREVMRRFVENQPRRRRRGPGTGPAGDLRDARRGKTQAPRLQLLSEFGRIERVEGRRPSRRHGAAWVIDSPKPFDQRGRVPRSGAGRGSSRRRWPAPARGPGPIDHPIGACPDLHDHTAGPSGSANWRRRPPADSGAWGDWRVILSVSWKPRSTRPAPGGTPTASRSPARAAASAPSTASSTCS